MRGAGVGRRLEAARAVASDFDEDRYRAQVREALLVDDAIDWDALASALPGASSGN
ncbi:hypothetical protein [Sphingomonas hengshuiensis]|uniref:hypothetical protein n=1 Tax=Sphingomonas hengshuiensis TaxID=1609977 RepID=UPI0012B8F7ED|nr:hypothetical protein [Sphingomonas hengshuiensis]